MAWYPDSLGALIAVLGSDNHLSHESHGEVRWQRQPMSRPKSGVYAITNTESNKVYIGSTVGFRRRWVHHRSQLYKSRHRNSHLQHAWNLYGETAFEFGILEYLDNPEELHLAEQFWVDVYREEGKELYNIGTPGRAPLLGRTHSEETRRKISKSLRDRQLSEEERRMMSKSRRGRQHSEEAKAKMAAAHAKPYPAFYNERTGKIIPKGVNLRALCREQNLDQSGMRKVIMSRWRQHRGWRLASEKEVQ